jgi:predicted nucleic acid-binding protein
LGYTLDTNAILYYLKDDAKAVSLLRKIFVEDAPVYISAITELELFAFSRISTQEQRLIEEVLKTVSVIHVDSHIARLASFIRREYRLKVPDRRDCGNCHVYWKRACHSQHTRFQEGQWPFSAKDLTLGGSIRSVNPQRLGHSSGL